MFPPHLKTTKYFVWFPVVGTGKANRQFSRILKNLEKNLENWANYTKNRLKDIAILTHKETITLIIVFFVFTVMLLRWM